MRKPVFGVFDQSDTNRAVQLLNMARGLKFRIQKVEGLYYPCITAKLISAFVFAYAKIRVSHDEAQLSSVQFFNARHSLVSHCKIKTYVRPSLIHSVCGSDIWFTFSKFVQYIFF